MSLVPSLLQAIVRVDGDALVMHAGDKPYVVSPTGQIDLASRGLSLDAVHGIVGQLLSVESRGALEEFGAVQYELPPLPEFPGEHFSVVAARGGDDLWVEVRRHRIPDDDRIPVEMLPPQHPDIAQAPQPVPIATDEFAGVAPTAAVPVANDEDLTVPEAAQLFPRDAETEETKLQPAVEEEPAAPRVEAPAYEPEAAPVAAAEEVPAVEAVEEEQPVAAAPAEEPALYELPPTPEAPLEPPLEPPPLAVDAPEAWPTPVVAVPPPAAPVLAVEPEPESQPEPEPEPAAVAEMPQQLEQSEEEQPVGAAPVAAPPPVVVVAPPPPAPAFAVEPEPESQPEPEPVVSAEEMPQLDAAEQEQPLAAAHVDEPAVYEMPPMLEVPFEPPPPLAVAAPPAPPPPVVVVAPPAPAPVFVVEPEPDSQPEPEPIVAAEEMPQLDAIEEEQPMAAEEPALYEMPPMLEVPFEPPPPLAVAAPPAPPPPVVVVAPPPPVPVFAVEPQPESRPEPEPQPEPVGVVEEMPREFEPSEEEQPIAAALAEEPAVYELPPMLEVPFEPRPPLAVAAPVAPPPPAIVLAPPQPAAREPLPPRIAPVTAPKPVAPPPIPAAPPEPAVVLPPKPMAPPEPAVVLPPKPIAPPEPAVVLPPNPVAPPEPAVVLPMTRNPIRPEHVAASVGDPTMDGLQRLLRIAAARGASSLYLSSDARPSVRVDGEMQTLDSEPVLSARDIESLLLTLMPDRSHEALRTGAPTEWMCDIDDVGRVRCTTFRDHIGPGGVFRLMPTRTVSLEQLGLPTAVQALAIEPEGLVLVAGPRSSGKRTLIGAFIDLINRSRRDHVITIEREISVVHPSGSSFISQREVRGSDEDLLVAARAALREDPDVLVIEDLRTGALMNVALEAASSGRLVIGGFSAHNATEAIDRIIDLYAPEYRRQVQLAIADTLRAVVAQVLLRKAGGGRTAAREVLLNTPAVSGVIAEGKTSQLPMAIEGGRRHGMMPLSDTLVSLVQSGVVDPREAYRHASDRAGLLAALKRQGVDTSFVERLA